MIVLFINSEGLWRSLILYLNLRDLGGVEGNPKCRCTHANTFLNALKAHFLVCNSEQTLAGSDTPSCRTHTRSS